MQNEIDELRAYIARYERNTKNTSWLFKQLVKQFKYVPRDSLRALRRMSNKKIDKLSKNLKEKNAKGIIRSHNQMHLDTLRMSDAPSNTFLEEIESFAYSDAMNELVSKAAVLEPRIGKLNKSEAHLLPPWNDSHYSLLRSALNQIPNKDFNTVVLMPAGRMGGADLVAGVLARAIEDPSRTLIIRTDDAHWDRPDWYPQEATAIDLSKMLKAVSQPERALYTLLHEVAPKRIFNVNSKLAFDCFVKFGERLALSFQLYAYYFCADRDVDGNEVGYPTSYFDQVFPHLTTAMIDTVDLAEILIDRFSLGPEQKKKLKTIYTPALTELAQPAFVFQQQESRSKRSRPMILWAGRLDKQKRFDLVIEIAKSMPDVDFAVWGKAVLDKKRKYRNLPSNIKMNGTFKGYDDLPIGYSDGWLYTSEWDGLPTILIEIGALGIPIVASAVGGVPELIDESTGWPIDGDKGAAAYVDALRTMLNAPDQQIKRVAALQKRIVERHSMEKYKKIIANI